MRESNRKHRGFISSFKLLLYVPAFTAMKDLAQFLIPWDHYSICSLQVLLGLTCPSHLVPQYLTTMNPQARLRLQPRLQPLQHEYNERVIFFSITKNNSQQIFRTNVEMYKLWVVSSEALKNNEWKNKIWKLGLENIAQKWILLKFTWIILSQILAKDF